MGWQVVTPALYSSHIPNEPTMLNASTATKLDLLIADARGEIKYTVLKPRRARKGELIMSMTKGTRSNTNRRGQSYQGHATSAQHATVAGNASAYFKTSG